MYMIDHPISIDFKYHGKRICKHSSLAALLLTLPRNPNIFEDLQNFVFLLKHYFT